MHLRLWFELSARSVTNRAPRDYLRVHKESAVRVGIASWALPAQHAALFPGDGGHLARYAAVLDAVEINTSFYRAHRRQTYERWQTIVPEHFRFSVKLPRTISHESALVGCKAELMQFLEEVSGLGAKLGVLLLQLPGRFEFDRRLARSFLTTLTRLSTTPVVCEPRHLSWFSAPASKLLTDLGISRVAADPSCGPDGDRPTGGGPVAYYRLHGSPRMYYSSYDARALRSWSSRITACEPHRTSTWCIFDNTAAQAAIPNALALRAKLNTCHSTLTHHDDEAGSTSVQ